MHTHNGKCACEAPRFISIKAVKLTEETVCRYVYRKKKTNSTITKIPNRIRQIPNSMASPLPASSLTRPNRVSGSVSAPTPHIIHPSPKQSICRAKIPSCVPDIFMIGISKKDITTIEKIQIISPVILNAVPIVCLVRIFFFILKYFPLLFKSSKVFEPPLLLLYFHNIQATFL